MRMVRAHHIWTFADESGERPAIGNVNFVRLGIHIGAAVATDGVNLMAIPVVLAEDDVTGLVDARMLRRAVEAAPFLDYAEAQGGWEADDDEDDEESGLAEIALLPQFIVAGGIAFPRLDYDWAFPPIDKLMGRASGGKPIPFSIGLDGKRLAKIAAVLGPGVLLSSSEKDAPILVRPLAWDDGDLGVTTMDYYGVPLPWALLMPMMVNKANATERIGALSGQAAS